MIVFVPLLIEQGFKNQSYSVRVNTQSQSTQQNHPQYKSDRQLLNSLLKNEATDLNLVELARLIIRYRGFPGARDIQEDLILALNRWQISTEEELFEKTRQIHAIGQIYRKKDKGEEAQDWS